MSQDMGLLEVVSPLTGERLAVVDDATPEQTHDVVQKAADAFEDVWRKTSGTDRAQYLHRFADLVEQHADELGRLDTEDNGKLLRETTSQARFAARNYRFFAGAADKLTGATIPLDRYDTLDYTLREPVGVAALITAWNSPQQLLANKLAPALAAGCTVVIKPSELAPRSTLRLAELAMQAGYPEGVVNVITGGAESGVALTSDPLLGRISFTGSVATGQAITRTAAAALTPVTLELGGKSANIVFDDADLRKAIPGALAGIFAAGGQTCIAGSRLLVQDTVYREVVDELVARAAAIRLGDPSDSATQMGPVANRSQFDRIMSTITDARDGAGTLATGGNPFNSADFPRGLFIEPTIFTDVDPVSPLAQNEVFGPVLSIIPFASEQEAIRIANATEFGLASAVWTASLSRAHRVARELVAGTVWVNTYRYSAAQAPFGGVKKSGYGRERGVEAIGEYLRTKNVMIDLSDEAQDPFAARN